MAMLDGNGHAFKGGNSVKMVCLRSEKGFIIEGKNLLPNGKNSFLLEKTPQPWSYESIHEATKCVFLVNKRRKT